MSLRWLDKNEITAILKRPKSADRCRWHADRSRSITIVDSTLDSGNLLTPSPPAEKTTASQEASCCLIEISPSTLVKHHCGNCILWTMTPSPPAEKATARQDQAWKSSTGDGTGYGRRRPPARSQRRARTAPVRVADAAARVSRRPASGGHGWRWPSRLVRRRFLLRQPHRLSKK